MAESSQKELKRKLSRVVRILEDRYGPNVYPEERTLLEQLIYAVLSAESPITNARKAIRDFKDGYLDWNEVRVSSLREIGAVLEGARIDGAARLAETIQGLLETVFQELSRVDLDQLKVEGAEKTKKLVAKLTHLQPHEQQYLLVACGFEDAPPLDPATDRVCARVGIFRTDDSPVKRRKALETVVEPADAVRFHHLMAEHGKKLCTVEDPRCAKCLLQTDCDFFKSAEARKPAAGAKKDAAGKKEKAGDKKGAKATKSAKTAKNSKASGRRGGDDEEE